MSCYRLNATQPHAESNCHLSTSGVPYSLNHMVLLLQKKIAVQSYRKMYRLSAVTRKKSLDTIRITCTFPAVICLC